MTEIPRHVTVRKVCEMLSIGKTLVYDLVGKGVIPSRRLGGRILIPVDGLAELLGRKPEPAAEPEPEPAPKPGGKRPPGVKLKLW